MDRTTSSNARTINNRHNNQINALMPSQVYQNNRNIQRGRSHALNIQPGQVRQQFHPQTNAYYDDMLNQFVNGHIVIYPQETYFETVQDENNTLSILENAYR
ncbi:10360_t:CDS:2 [Ambispora leptoticha]|uniref:10360_t:CDS:1 n=1 Tax=Ambispora leptoticha TaxID=144679 RepID=A0A9N8WIX2_9GLOM|nr:10360_t:CDS:2 [Ambispora leptoticha]